MGLRITQYFVLVSITLVWVAFSNQFVVQEKSKYSSHKLKEQCCEQYVDIMHKVPAMMHAIADLQTAAFDTLRQYCEGESSCFKGLKKVDLIKYNKLLNEITIVCNKFTSEITDLLEQVNSLKNV